MLTLYTMLQTAFDQLACALLHKPDQQDSVGFWQGQALAPDWPLFGYRLCHLLGGAASLAQAVSLE